MPNALCDQEELTSENQYGNTFANLLAWIEENASHPKLEFDDIQTVITVPPWAKHFYRYFSRLCQEDYGLNFYHTPLGYDNKYRVAIVRPK